MTRTELKELARAFMKTYGYIAKPAGHDNALLFARPTGLGGTDEYLVYFHERGEEKNESRLSATLSKLAKRHSGVPGGRKGRRFFLSTATMVPVPKPVGINEFTFQVPVLFFDREFSAHKQHTPVMALEAETSRYELERIEQPYASNSETENDLLDRLLQALAAPQEPCLHVVVAPAGYGKTVLMASLYGKLKQRFQRCKSQRRSGMRPLLMLPGHLKQAADVGTLVRNFIGDEYDYGMVSEEAFGFWLGAGMTVWLLDGLEELILKSAEEFVWELLERYVFAPGKTNPQVVVAIRKPILATSPELADYIAEWEGTGIKRYDLCDWGPSQARQYFQKNLSISAPEKDGFLAELSRSDPLQKLCRVPYYCSIIAGLRNEGQTRVFGHSTDLVEFAIRELCAREFDKGLDKDIVPVEKQIELLTELAAESSRGRKVTGEMLTDYSEVLLSDYPADVRLPQIRALRRHAMLSTRGDEPDVELDFIQDTLKQFLLGTSLADKLRTSRLDDFDEVEVEPGSVTMEYLLRNVADVDWNSVATQLYSLQLYPDDVAVGFRNIMRVLLATDIPNKSALISGLLENKNLTGLRFKGLDLSGVSFSHSKLRDVTFEQCDLRKAAFDCCQFTNTGFVDDCNLEGATTDGAMLGALQVGGKLICDKKGIQRWLYEHTRVPPERHEPCQAVINMVRVLEKIVRKGRGHSMPRQFLVRTKCEGGIPAERCIAELSRNGYLTVDGNQARIRIDKFDEVKSFVGHSGTTEGIREVLDSVCPDTRTGCNHIYKE